MAPSIEGDLGAGLDAFEIDLSTGYHAKSTIFKEESSWPRWRQIVSRLGSLVVTPMSSGRRYGEWPGASSVRVTDTDYARTVSASSTSSLSRERVRRNRSGAGVYRLAVPSGAHQRRLDAGCRPRTRSDATSIRPARFRVPCSRARAAEQALSQHAEHGPRIDHRTGRSSPNGCPGPTAR
jgi:hypothetical protein